MKPNIIFFSFNLTFGLVSQNVLDTEQINAVSVERMKKKNSSKIIIFLYTSSRYKYMYSNLILHVIYNSFFI